MKKLNKNNKGFSLVELLVVIAIMVVLVGVLAPSLLSNIEKTRESKDIQALDTLAGNIVSGKPREIMPEDRVFWGNVLHNMGNAYAQLFDFEAAGACFEKAYELNENEASEKCRQMAYELAKLSIDGQVDAAESLKDCEALAAEWKQEYLEYIR